MQGPELYEMWGRAFADRPVVAEVCRRKAAVARTLRGDRRVDVSPEHLQQIIATAVRPRERRDRTGRSSARSGDSGDDGPSDSWSRFVRDVVERISEQEVAREGWWS